MSEARTVGAAMAAILEEPAYEAHLAEVINAGAMGRRMVDMRIALGITQRQVAEALQCSPSRISKLESGDDDRVSWTDMMAYFAALRVDARLVLDPKELPTADRLRTLRSGGTLTDDTVVATVNGEPINRGALEVHVATADLLGLGGKSREELLNDLIDDALLTQAAIESGVRVEDWEVDAAIRGGILDPLNSPETPPDIVELVNSVLDARGASAATALDHDRIRAAYRGLVIRGRYLQELRKSREDVLPGLRQQARVVILDQGAAPR